MFTTFEHNFEDLESNPDHDINVCKPDVIMTVDGVPLSPPEYDELDNREGEEKKKKGERITLADLFLADAVVKEKLDPDHFFPNSGKKLCFEPRMVSLLPRSSFLVLKELKRMQVQ